MHSIGKSFFGSDYKTNREAQTILKLNQFKGQKDKESVMLLHEVDSLYKSAKTVQEKIKLLLPIKHFCLKTLQADLPFNSAHIIFLKIVIQIRSYREAIQILEYPFIQTGSLKPNEILSYLYYCGIIWTVLQEYRLAADCFTLLNKIQKKDTNLKTDTIKKLHLIKLLLGDEIYERDRVAQYDVIVNKLEIGEGLSDAERKLLIEDGNIKLADKIKNSFLFKELNQVSLLYNRVSIKTLNPTFAQPQTIYKLNKLRHTYRYDPRTQCLIFEGKKTDIQKAISKTVKTYFGIVAEEQNLKSERSEVSSFFM